MLWIVGSGTVLLAGVVSYATARRYGWGLALLLPIFALVALIGMRWQRTGLSGSEAMQAAGQMLVFASPMLLGVAIGIAVARLRR